MRARTMAEALDGRRSGSTWLARCPAHDDRNPSLAIRECQGRLLVHCHAGCTQRAVIEALRRRGLCPEGVQAEPAEQALPPVVAEYVYTDERGTPLFRVTRHEPKTFRQWRPDAKGGWLAGLGRSTRIVPYRLRELIEAPIVFVVEGEKDVETLRAWGFVATCNPGGAGKWRPEFAEYFRGRTVIVVPDCDRPGRAHAEQVKQSLKPVAAQLITVDLSDDGAKDITEWFERGHSEVELLNVIETAWRFDQEEVR